MRTQRTETGVRWFLLGVLEPADRRSVLERELAYMAAQHDHLQTIADAMDAMPGPHPFGGTVDLGLRVNAVMTDWLREQLAATEPDVS